MTDDIAKFGLATIKEEGKPFDTDPGAPKRAPLSAEDKLRHGMHFYGGLCLGRFSDVIECAEQLDPAGARTLLILKEQLQTKIQEIAGDDPA